MQSRLWTRIGVPAEERAHPQRLLASVTMHMDLGRVCVSDDIESSVNYADIAQEIQALRKTERLTIERLVQDIATSVLAHTKIQSVTVTIEEIPDSRCCLRALYHHPTMTQVAIGLGSISMRRRI